MLLIGLLTRECNWMFIRQVMIVGWPNIVKSLGDICIRVRGACMYFGRSSW